MGRDAIDKKKSVHWAIAPMVSGGLVVNFSRFDLVNLDTGRARQVSTIGAGASIGGNTSTAAATADYALFRTIAPMNFDDFDYKEIYIISVSSAAYGITLLQVRLASVALATIFSHGWGAGVGVSGVSSFLFVDFSGNGKPVGKPPVLKIPPKDRFKKLQKFVKFQSIPKAKPSIVLPDALFAFNDAKIQPQNQASLVAAAILLGLRSSPDVSVEGHTDSVGTPQYNLNLSRKRAVAVKDWFVGHKIPGATSFKTVGHGETKPCSPNKRPDGSDNPQGRALNRRVEIVADIKLG